MNDALAGAEHTYLRIVQIFMVLGLAVLPAIVAGNQKKEEYVLMEKTFEGKRPKIVIHIIKKGRKAFYDYIEELKAFIEEN